MVSGRGRIPAVLIVLAAVAALGAVSLLAWPKQRQQHAVAPAVAIQDERWGTGTLGRRTRSRTASATLPDSEANTGKPDDTQPGAPAERPVQYDYSGDWAEFVDAALPRGFPRRGTRGVLVVRLTAILEPAGLCPEEAQTVVLASLSEAAARELLPGEGIYGPQPALLENVKGYAEYVVVAGHRFRPKERLPSEAKGLVEFKPRDGRISAVSYSEYAAPPTTRYGAAAIYAREREAGPWLYRGPLGDVLQMRLGMGIIDADEGVFPRLFMRDEMPEEILGKLERRVALTSR